MKRLHTIPPLVLTALLAACGGSGSSSNADSEKSEPQTVTSANIAQAIGISGATPVSVNPADIPSNLAAVETSNVNSSGVSASSKFNVELTVPSDSVPAGKKVAGYLVEINKSEMSFILAKEATASAASKVIEAPAQKSKSAKSNHKLKPSPQTKTRSPFVAASVEGNTSVDFSGWENSDFSLNQSLEDISLRIFPLLVDDAVVNISSIDDIDLTDETNWVGVQDLVFNIQAVATAEIQISLTWNSITDIDLWVVEPNGTKISYEAPFSATSLGWLDYDNTVSYGPENITFNYKMPEGDYKVYVHHFNGGVETDYQVTISIGDDINTYSGNFPEGVTDSEAIDDAGVDFITSIVVDSAINEQLATTIPTSQYQGTWKLPENSSVPGYVDVKGDIVTVYIEYGEQCLGHEVLVASHFSTGFSASDGKLQITDAALGGLGETAESNINYNTLTLALSSLPSNCTTDYYYDEEDQIVIPSAL